MANTNTRGNTNRTNTRGNTNRTNTRGNNKSDSIALATTSCEMVIHGIVSGIPFQGKNADYVNVKVKNHDSDYYSMFNVAFPLDDFEDNERDFNDGDVIDTVATVTTFYDREKGYIRFNITAIKGDIPF